MASTQPAPSSQVSGVRPISFVLVNSANPGGSIVPSNVLTLYIRPEELTRTDTSRINPQQTLGGTIWADNFGPGMPVIQISGHTGWRPPADPAMGTDDGVARFKKLRDQVFVNWHAYRQIAIQGGRDPDSTVQLQFADQLDSIAAVVMPMSFVLRRSRNRPLLYMYNIHLIVTQDNIAQPTLPPIANLTNSPAALTTAQQVSAAIASLTGSINTITSQISSVSQYIDATIAAPVAQFMTQTGALYGAIVGAVNSVQGVTNSLISVGQLAAQCGVNIFRSLATIADLPSIIRANLMEIASAYSNALCVLINALVPPPVYPSYQALYGSSNCSSTSGGQPPSSFANLNPFQYTNPQQVPDAVTASPQAQAAMKSMASTDIVRSTPSLDTIGNTAGTAAAGLQAAA